MSGFDTTWLDLREPADRRARDAGLLAKAAALLGQSGGVVVDLGCGTGATCRALSSLLPLPVVWRLVDHDPLLLDAATARLAQHLAKQPNHRTETVRLDLAQLDGLPLEPATLITASALFDLCSAAFVDGLGTRLAQRGLGLYAALNYDGTIIWTPAHPLDAAVVQLFNRHQRSDKGLGLALGPEAAGALADTFTRLGYEVACADSPWELAREDEALQTSFVDGIVQAVAELDAIDPAALRAWHIWRLDAVADGATCHVGHLDILATPIPRP
jgi:SAM-dependent methyltransferase